MNRDESIEELNKKIYIDIDFTKEISMDFEVSDGYREDFSWIYHTTDQYQYEQWREWFGLDELELDFSENDYLISLGRKLKSAYYVNEGGLPGAVGNNLYPIFYKEYDKNKAYIYRINQDLKFMSFIHNGLFRLFNEMQIYEDVVFD